MNSHDLAKQLLSMPNVEVSASIDDDTGTFDNDGDKIVDKIFAYDIIELIGTKDEIVLQFETCEKQKG